MERPLTPTFALVHGFRDPEAVETDPEWYGRIFETAVGASLTRSNGRMYYWREGKFEVDFIVKLSGRLYAVEVKSSRKRRSGGLAAFISKYPDSTPLIINRDNGFILLPAR